MSVKTANYAANLTNSTSLRGPSPSIWYDCPVPDFQQDPSLGMHFFDDFLLSGNPGTTASAVAASLGAWSTYAYTGATIGDGQLEGGVLTFGSDGDNEGLTFLSSSGSFRLVTTSTLALNQKLWFEARVATSTVTATKRDDFVGLAIPALSSGLPRAAYPITATDDTLDATNGTFIGFHRKGTAAPTDWQFCFCLAGGTVNYVTGLTTLRATAGLATLTANTFTKLGFVFDPNAITKLVTSATARQTAGTLRRALIRVFADGVELPTFLSSDDVQNATAGQAFPTGFMAPVIATMNQTASSPGTASVDWVRCAQVANS